MDALNKIFVKQPDEEFQFSLVDQSKVEEILCNLPKKTSCGDDEISYMELKDSSFYISAPLTQIINLKIKTNHWPRR